MGPENYFQILFGKFVDVCMLTFTFFNNFAIN